MPQTLRRRLADLQTVASGSLVALYREVSSLAEARVALSDVLPKVVQTYGEAAAYVAAEWYTEVRAKAGARTFFEAIPADVGRRGTDELAAWATSTASDLDSLSALVAGGLQRRISDVARETVMGSTFADPSAVGWQRQAAGGCSFCVMLAGRGAVYSEATADFASHDHCQCQAVPLFEGAEPIDVKPYQRSARDISDTDRARVRKWIATHDLPQ